MMRRNHLGLKQNARELRKNMTPEERKLWYNFLKKLTCPVYRQHIIGSYIVDFYIASSKLVIELDGSQHNDVLQKESDAIRDAYMNGLGLRVLRFWNSDVNSNFKGVCETIENMMKSQ